MIPLQHLAEQGLVADRDFAVQRFDVLVGKHGDHVGGERDAAKALLARQGRRGVHDRRQPPGVRAGRHAAARRRRA
jgi:hypothetical protein